MFRTRKQFYALHAPTRSVSLRETIRATPVQLTFADEISRRLFSSKALLESGFEPPLPARIMVRIAVLQAAPNLGVVSRRPPLGLRRSGDEYLIDLTPTHALRILPQGASPSDPASITRACIVGVRQTHP